MKLVFTAIALVMGWASSFAAQPTIDVLITGQNIRRASPYLDKYREACAKEGINVHFALHGSAVDYTQIPLEMMKKFHVIVFHGSPVTMPSCEGDEKQVAEFRHNLEQFHRMGGAIMWQPMSMKKMPREWNEEIGSKYGVKLLQEDLFDPTKLVDVNPGMKKKYYSYLWTTNIAKHPVTDGVNGLFLPTVGEWSWPGTVPAQFEPDWEVLIRAMDSTRTIGNAAAPETVANFSPEVAGSIASAPAIVATRESKAKGEGRMMLFPLYSAHTYQNFGHFVFNEALMINGAEGHPSDAHRLLMNAYKWLAVPAQAAGLGGYKAVVREKSEVNRTPIAWDNLKPLPGNDLTGSGDETKAFSGFIGAKSQYGGGTGSVEEYAKEAKALGMSYLVFLDDASKLTTESYKKLVSDCAKASNADFLAIPGYSFKESVGNSIFLINPKNAPLPDLWDEHGKIKNFWGLMMREMASGIGLQRFNDMPVDPFYYFWITCAAPYTWEKDRLADNGFDEYRKLQGIGPAFMGVAVTEVKQPSDLKAAAQSAHQTVVHAPSLPEVCTLLTKRDFSKVYPLYVTNGPRFQHWAIRQSESDSFRAGGERYRLELNAVSDNANIKEVAIIDAQTGKPYRIFKPATGSRTFSCTIDEAHKTQKYLIPVVTDEHGRTAVGSALHNVQRSNYLLMMTDRLMGMHHSLLFNKQKQEKVDISGWLGSPTWVKQSNKAGSYPSVNDERLIRIFGFDGGRLYQGAVDFRPSVTTTDGIEPIVPGYRFRNRLASYDIAIEDFDGQLQFDKPVGYQHSVVPCAPTPTQIADISSREWAVRPRVGTQTASNYHDFTAKFKKATTLNRFDVCALRRWDKAQPCHWFIRDASGEVEQVVAKGSRFSRSGVLRPGDYLYPANEIGGPTGIINLGPTELSYTADESGAKVYVDGKGKAVQPGEIVSARVICFARDRNSQNDGAWLKKFVSDFGIDGKKPGYPASITQGTVTSSAYSLDLNPANGGATVEFKSYDLPHNVPVQVNALPENAVVGRYDIERKHLLVLPVFENVARTTVNTTVGDTKLYVGELFHCDDNAVILSSVQDGADKLLVEIHNPTAIPRKVNLAAAPGFTPLQGLKQSYTVEPFSSVKATLAAAAGSLADIPPVQE